jgi:probable rRNA maturation factor
MAFQVEINNQTKSPVRDDFLAAIVKKALLKCGLKRNKNYSVSLAFISAGDIQKINIKYRKINQPTDILSFSEYPSLKIVKQAGEKNIFLGELILCYDYIRNSAKINHRIIQQELKEVVVHGVLHLLGYQHGKQMFDLQRELINSSK